MRTERTSCARTLSANGLHLVEGRVDDELGREPRLAGCQLDKELVALGAVELHGVLRVDDGALHAGHVHRGEGPLSRVAPNRPVMAPSKSHVRVEHGHRGSEMEVNLSHEWQ